jgi:hypothetical protein
VLEANEVVVALMSQSLKQAASKALSLADKEVSALKTLHAESQATVRRMAERDPQLRKVLDVAYAYAVFPSIGKASAVVGAAFGKGDVFQGGGLVGYAGLIQLTLGVQLGGDTFIQVVAFEDKPAFERFKSGRLAFAASASAVLVKPGAAASAYFDSGVMVFVSSEGGMLLEAAIGAQKFLFKPAVIGRTKTAPARRKTRKEAMRATPKPAQKSAPPRSARRRPPTHRAKATRKRARA